MDDEFEGEAEKGGDGGGDGRVGCVDRGEGDKGELEHGDWR